MSKILTQTRIVINSFKTMKTSCLKVSLTKMLARLTGGGYRCDGKNNFANLEKIPKLQKTFRTCPNIIIKQF
jgi:hypothetical protein